MSSSSSPCAACKLQRRKCTQECVFAPYFPPDQPQKFAYIHKVFGASNVAKLLNELNASQREDAVHSLFYEAEARLRNPVYGCVGMISILQQRLKQLQCDLSNAKKELATYIGPQAMAPVITNTSLMPQHLVGMVNPSSSPMLQHNMMQMMGIPTGAASGQLVIREPQLHHQHQQQQQQHQHHQQQHEHHQQQQQQLYEAQQVAAALAVREKHQQQQQELFRNYEENPQRELFRNYEQQHPQQDQDLFRSYEQQQEMFRAYEQQPPQQQELFRTYEQQQQQQQPQQHELFRTYEQQQQHHQQQPQQQELFRSYEQHQHQHQHHQQQPQLELATFNSGIEQASGSVTATGLNQMTGGGAAMLPSLALGQYDPYQTQAQQQPLEHHNHHPHAHELQAQLLLQQPEQGHIQSHEHQPQHQRSGSEELRNIRLNC